MDWFLILAFIDGFGLKWLIDLYWDYTKRQNAERIKKELEQSVKK